MNLKTQFYGLKMAGLFVLLYMNIKVTYSQQAIRNGLKMPNIKSMLSQGDTQNRECIMRSTNRVTDETDALHDLFHQ